MRASQYGRPLIVHGLTGSAARSLNRVELQKSGAGQFDERWLQMLISAHPNLLPIEQIEPALTPIISVCVELPVRSGFVDNLFVTPAGDLIVGETKLYRNPGARREVIGQIFDYAKDLSAMSYDQLDAAIAGANAPDGQGGHPKRGLHAAVSAHPDGKAISEADFIDAVSRNLKRGRFLLLIVGDGLHSGIEHLSEFIQQHAGMHFTLGVVELAVFNMPTEAGGYLVQPRVLARTHNVERAIVRIEDGAITVKAAAMAPAGSNPSTAKVTISSELFYEALAKHYPQAVSELKAFVVKAEKQGITAGFGKDSLNLRWHPDESRAFNLGSVTTAGKVGTDFLNGPADTIGRIDLSHTYLKKLAELVPGAWVKQPSSPLSCYVAKGSSLVTIDGLLARDEGWLQAMVEFMESASSALKGQP